MFEINSFGDDKLYSSIADESINRMKLLQYYLRDYNWIVLMSFARTTLFNTMTINEMYEV